MLYKIKAYYQTIFNLDLTKLNATEEDGIPVFVLKDQELVDFLFEHQFNIGQLANDAVVVITDEEEPRIYGELTQA